MCSCSARKGPLPSMEPEDSFLNSQFRLTLKYAFHINSKRLYACNSSHTSLLKDYLNNSQSCKMKNLYKMGFSFVFRKDIWT
jgi:hypothetical protein